MAGWRLAGDRPTRPFALAYCASADSSFAISRFRAFGVGTSAAAWLPEAAMPETAATRRNAPNTARRFVVIDHTMRRKPCFLPQHVTHSPCVTCIIPALASAGVGLGHRGRTEQLHGVAGCRRLCCARPRRPDAALPPRRVDHHPGRPHRHPLRDPHGMGQDNAVTADGHEILLTVLGPGEVFGEFEAIRSHGRAPRRQRRCARRGGVSGVHR